MNTDWLPLERMLGPSLCADFMFMGTSEQIHLYKHRDTRRYLNIAPDGTCFRYSVQGYQPIGVHWRLGERANAGRGACSNMQPRKYTRLPVRVITSA